MNHELTDTSGWVTEPSRNFRMSDEFEIIEELPSAGYNRLFKAVRYGKYFKRTSRRVYRR